MADALGPHSERAGLSADQVDRGELPRLRGLSNGLVMELHNYHIRTGVSPALLLEWIYSLGLPIMVSELTPSHLRIKLKRLREIHRRHVSKKSGKGKNWTDIENEPFWRPRITEEPGTADNLGNATLPIVNDLVASDEQEPHCSYATVPVDRVVPCHTPANDHEKHVNTLSHGIAKKERQLSHLTETIDLAKNQLDDMKRKGHYNVKNVRRREATANQRHMQHLSLKRELHLTKSKLQRKQRELEKANTGERESATRSSDAVRELMVLTQNIKDNDETTVRLNGEIHSLKVEVEALTLQKKSAQNEELHSV